MKLSELVPGDTAVVTRVLGNGAVHRRILSMGILPGVIVKVLRESPLGDPVAYEIRGARISLRKSEAALVEVNKVVRLSDVPPGETVKVVTLEGGMGFVRNLSMMGISPGREIKIISACCPMKVETEKGIHTVGRGIAMRVYVR